VLYQWSLTVQQFSFTWNHPSGFGGLGLCMLASGTEDRGFAPDRSLRIFPVGKIHGMSSFGEEVK
jgi:hypothetical protein